MYNGIFGVVLAKLSRKIRGTLLVSHNWYGESGSIALTGRGWMTCLGSTLRLNHAAKAVIDVKYWLRSRLIHDAAR